MDKKEYFQSITDELNSLKNRLRCFIKNKHWLADGEWKESIIRTILKRHLPEDIGIGRGFVITKEGPTSQIDILLYDKSQPMLFKDDNFIIATPTALRGIIEVKTNLTTNMLRNAIRKIFINLEKIHRNSVIQDPFVGIYSYGDKSVDDKIILKYLKRIRKTKINNTINSISVGDNLYMRFWNEKEICYKSYFLEKMSPAYFINNCIEYLSYRGNILEDSLWYPKESKEPHLLNMVKIYE